MFLVLFGVFLHLRKAFGGLYLWMWKFLGQGVNLCHSNNPSCSSDNTVSFTCWATRGLQGRFSFSFFFFSFPFLHFLGLLPRAYGGSQARGRIRAESPAYTRATATKDLSHICNLHHSSQQHQLLNLLSKARDQTRNLMVPSRIH